MISGSTCQPGNFKTNHAQSIFYRGAPIYYNDLVLFAHYTTAVNLALRGGCRWSAVVVVARRAGMSTTSSDWFPEFKNLAKKKAKILKH
jgi:hypothetical protein